MTDAQAIMSIAQKYNDLTIASEFIQKGRSLEDYRKDLVVRQRSKASKTATTVNSTAKGLTLTNAIRSLVEAKGNKKTINLPFSSVFNKRSVGTVNPASAGILTAPGYNTDFLTGFGDTPFLNDFGVRQMPTTGHNEYLIPSTGKSVSIDQEKLEFGNGVQKDLNLNPITLKPHGFQVYTPVSKEVMMQSYYNVESIIRDDFALTLDATVQDYAMKKFLATAGVHAATVNASDLTYKFIEGFTGEILDDIGSYAGDSVKYITNNKVANILRTTQKGDALGFILENGQIGEQKLVTSSSVKNSADGTKAYIFVGKASDAAIGFWQGFQITVDEGFYLNGDTLVRADVYFDAALVRPEHFGIITVNLNA